MTRINTVDPKLLPSPWLLAEYRELPRIINRVAAGRPFRVPAGPYRMGAGHVSFFGDKLHWLYQRHAALVAEMRRRKYNPVMNLDAAMATCMVKRPDLCRPEVWQPSPTDHVVCLTRLKERWKGTQVEWFQFLVAVIERHPLPRAEATPLFMELLPCS
jgi:Pyrimidine dimer DNA glycosylase.